MGLGCKDLAGRPEPLGGALACAGHGGDQTTLPVRPSTPRAPTAPSLLCLLCCTTRVPCRSGLCTGSSWGQFAKLLGPGSTPGPWGTRSNFQHLGTCRHFRRVGVLNSERFLTLSPRWGFVNFSHASKRVSFKNTPVCGVLVIRVYNCHIFFGDCNFHNILLSFPFDAFHLEF